MIDLRNALMGGKRLPYDAEVEYLESTGTQWIDTGVVLNQSSAVELGGRAIANVGFSFFGARVSYNSRGFAIARFSAGWLGSQYGSGQATRVLPVDDKWHVFRQIKEKFSIDEVHTYDYTEQTFDTPHSALLFCLWSGTAPAPLGQMQISYCKIWDANGVLVRDFIPVRKGTVGYLYDRVSGKLFGNEGTGDFVLGPDVVPVEYIESYGTEYIDTGIVCQNSNVTAFEFKFAYTKYPSTRYVWGSDKGANQGINNLGHYFSGLDDSNVVIPLQTYHTGRSEVHPSSIVKAYIDGTQFRSNTGSDPYTNPFCLFALGGYTIQRIDGLRISSCKVLVDSTLIRDYKAIRVGTDATSWEGAMMDVLTRRIYRNAGTGAFTYGNDLRYPIPAE